MRERINGVCRSVTGSGRIRTARGSVRWGARRLTATETAMATFTGALMRGPVDHHRSGIAR